MDEYIPYIMFALSAFSWFMAIRRFVIKGDDALGFAFVGTMSSLGALAILGFI